MLERRIANRVSIICALTPWWHLAKHVVLRTSFSSDAKPRRRALLLPSLYTWKNADRRLVKWLPQGQTSKWQRGKWTLGPTTELATWSLGIQASELLPSQGRQVALGGCQERPTDGAGWLGVCCNGQQESRRATRGCVCAVQRKGHVGYTGDDPSSWDVPAIGVSSYSFEFSGHLVSLAQGLLNAPITAVHILRPLV